MTMCKNRSRQELWDVPWSWHRAAAWQQQYRLYLAYHAEKYDLRHIRNSTSNKVSPALGGQQLPVIQSPYQSTNQRPPPPPTAGGGKGGKSERKKTRGLAPSPVFPGQPENTDATTTVSTTAATAPKRESLARTSLRSSKCNARVPFVASVHDPTSF